MSQNSSLFGSSTWRRGFFAGFTAFLLLMFLQSIGALRRMEDGAQDWLRAKYAEPYKNPIEIIYLDDISLKEAESQFQLSFPWPRETYAYAIDFLRQAGAKAIVFDFLFTSASSYGPDDDKILAKAIKRHGKVYSGMQFTASAQPDAVGDFLKQSDLYRLKDAPADGLFEAHGIDAPKAPLWGAWAGVGDTYFKQDEDGMGRSTRLAVSLNDRVYPSLALSAALGLGADLPRLRREANFNVLFRQPKGVKGASSLFDVAASWPRMQGGEAPLVDAARFKDKIVLIGSSAPGLHDLRPTPLGKAMPGVELQAMVLDNLLSGESLRIVRRNNPWLWVGLLILCLAVSGLSFRFRGPAVILPMLIAGIASAAAAVWSYQNEHLLLPIATPCLAALLAFTHSAVENFVAERRSRLKVTSVFGQFLSPAVLSTLREKGNSLEMGGETRELTVFFSDLQGFTSFSEVLSPHDLVVILNEYLGDMTELLAGKYDATVDKYIGDAIMCFWNAPTDQKDHALRGAKAAWACQIRLAEVQAKLSKLGLDAGAEGLVMRIGLNTGPAIAGLMGSKHKLNYTVMGDTVNTASRLEGANKPYGTRIMISAATKDAAGPTVLTRPLDYIKVKGKAGATPVFEIIGIQGEPGRLYDDAYVASWSAALDQYKRGDFKAALAGFEACSKKEAKDKAVLLFIERCQHFVHEAPEQWDGVYTMKTK